MVDNNHTEAEYKSNPGGDYYDLCGEDKNDLSAPHNSEKHYRYVQILVKEGTMTVSGEGAYLSGNARTASIRPCTNMRIYGGYSKEALDKSIADRDPRAHVTTLTANVLNGGYDYHSIHVVSIANSHDVIVDGFTLAGGNANVAPEPNQEDYDDYQAWREKWEYYLGLANGGGLAINNANEPDADRRDMTGHIIRNCVISNCAAPEGAGVYVNGAASNTYTGERCRAELTMVNCVVRNNTAGDTYKDPDKYVEKPDDTIETMQITKAGVVTANANAKIWVRIRSERVALHGNFDTIAVRVQNGCRRVHQGSVCAGSL